MLPQGEYCPICIKHTISYRIVTLFPKKNIALICIERTPSYRIVTLFPKENIARSAPAHHFSGYFFVPPWELLKEHLRLI